MDLSIIIVNYNVKEFLQNLLHSISKAAANLKYEVIVVDNASDDGSVEMIKEKFHQVKLIENKKNLGFSKANNSGLKCASGDYLLLINPDAIVSEDTFDKMIDFFKRTLDAGLVTCKILNPDGTLQLACRRSFPGPWTSFCKVTGLSSLFPKSRLFARYNLTYLDENQTYEVDAISGSFMMFRREVYEKIGGLDEQFFMYGEDLDFCYRVQKSGYKVYYFNETQIIHYKGESTKRSSIDETKYFYNAMYLFVKKHLSSSFLVKMILTCAIWFKQFFAFLAVRKLIVISLVLDFILFDVCLFLGSKIYSSISYFRGFPEYGTNIVYTIPPLINILAASIAGTYKKDSISVLRNFGAILAGFILLSSLTLFFKQYAYSRAVIIITYVLLFFALTSWRVFVKLFFRLGIDRDKFARRRTLIVGTNEPAVKAAKKLAVQRLDNHTIVGLIGFSHKDIGKNIDGFDVLGSKDNIIKVIKEQKINDVIFPSDELSYNQMMSIVSSCQNENVEFKLIGSNLDFLVGKTSVSVLEDLPLFEIKYNISNPLFKIIKAMFDYILASFVLFLIYPFIYLISKLRKRKSEFATFILNVPSIFSGKVSFVGPKDFRENSDFYLGKKGLTGYWFIEPGNNLDYDKLDIFYAKNQNIWLDLEILGKSLIKMWYK